MLYRSLVKINIYNLPNPTMIAKLSMTLPIQNPGYKDDVNKFLVNLNMEFKLRLYMQLMV